jgi:hypothetical protein
MAIADKDLKKLSGLAAGRCSKPGCGAECIKFLDAIDPTIIGEMAHVIAHQPGGPRGQPHGGEDTYQNLILLCPTHHTEIDRAPDGIFTVDTILQWKNEHEARVREALSSSFFTERRDMAVEIQKMLVFNRAVWEQYGPDSQEAIYNPISSAQKIWELRKLSTIVPNNRRIAEIVAQHQRLFEAKDFIVGAAFIEHAAGFEKNCYVRTEGVPRFPSEFGEIVDRYAAA